MNVIEKRLAVEKEQTRIAQELHDSVGHGLVSIMTLLKLSLIDKNNSNENTKKALQASELLLNDVRKCVVGIKTDTKSSISARIQDFICNYNSGNSCIEFTEMGEENHITVLHPTQFSALFVRLSPIQSDTEMQTKLKLYLNFQRIVSDFI